ncbi:hypothetical protein MO867_16390 [Microbulbifer sp. OS29]|uniref:Uncharacterized protein n=1 Tax=Microbulbifer okhotskensis TaxID=2926617 RepID=A0A9X2ER82_9GAMM|nr:hypothetical protein [Microbulbifer okhotskensis]MCO1335915.1 hypothetical protein [Microbulbifer okhotskensis]
MQHSEDIAFSAQVAGCVGFGRSISESRLFQRKINCGEMVVLAGLSFIEWLYMMVIMLFHQKQKKFNGVTACIGGIFY